MLTRLYRRLLVPAFAFGFVCAFLPAPAAAQPTVERWSGLKPAGLDTVYVQDRAGTETSGKLLQLNRDSLMLLVDGIERRFELGDVSRIQKRDSLKNGTVAGAIVGAVMGMVAAGLSDCPGGDPGGSCAAFRSTTLALSVGAYAGLGTGVDALVRGRSTLYKAPDASRAASAPGAVGRAALHVSIAW